MSDYSRYNKYNLYTKNDIEGFTIDSICLFLRAENFNKNTFEFIQDKISLGKISKGKFKDWYEGYHRNFRIRIHPLHCIYLNGSISVFIKGRVEIIKIFQLKEAIGKLGEDLKLNLHNANLYRIDLAINIFTDKPAICYTSKLFTDLPRFKRLEQDGGVRFETRKKVFAAYNKGKELKQRYKIHDFDNLIRLEFRLLKGVGKSSNIKSAIISDLYESDIMFKLVDLFNDYYKKIRKKYIIRDILKNENITPKRFNNILLTSYIEMVGEEEVFNQIDDLSNRGLIADSISKSRCKKMIRDLKPEKSILDPLMQEINDKIQKEISQLIKAEIISNVSYT